MLPGRLKSFHQFFFVEQEMTANFDVRLVINKFHNLLLLICHLLCR